MEEERLVECSGCFDEVPAKNAIRLENDEWICAFCAIMVSIGGVVITEAKYRETKKNKNDKQ